MGMTKTERTELRRVVRQQFKVLRAEVEQRKAELIADLEEQVEERYADEDKAWADAAHLAHEAIMEANRKVNDAYREVVGEQHVERQYVRGMLPDRPTGRQRAMKRVAAARVEEQVKGALLRLDRQEADLHKKLAIGALESEEAREFLEAIPTVGELVPSARLAELAEDLDGTELPPDYPELGGGR